jgi:hypothetical protein
MVLGPFAEVEADTTSLGLEALSLPSSEVGEPCELGFGAPRRHLRKPR